MTMLVPKVKSFLTPTQPCKANILIVEGWLSDSSLKAAKNEFKNNAYEYLITTGEPLPDAFELYQNGSLDFFIKGHIDHNFGTSHGLSVQAWGTSAGKEYPLMKVMINHNVQETFQVTGNKKEYKLHFQSDKIPDTISVSFINNAHTGNKDRNLFIGYLRLDTLTIPAKSDFTRYVIRKGDKTVTIRTNEKSFAEKAASQFIAWGIDSSKVISLPTPFVKWYRTFTSAVVVAEWLKNNHIPVKGVNICSEGNHARRTWLLYRRALQDSVCTGIISIPEPEYYKRNKMNLKFGVLNVWREFIAYLFMRYMFDYQK
jgi:hypothetical protein